MLFETERLTKLTENLISLNSCDKSTGRLNLSTFRLYDFIKPIITTFEGKCEKKNVKIDLTLGSKDYYVNADQSKIQQVCYNLLDNAVKFSKEDSTIYIKIVDKGEKIFISIKDEGIGIPKESIAKIWDRFYKTDLSPRALVLNLYFHLNESRNKISYSSEVCGVPPPSAFQQNPADAELHRGL